MKTRFVWALVALVLLVVWSGCRCKTENDFDVIQENVQYGTREVFDLRTQLPVQVPLLMDVIEPCKKSKDPRPLVVFFHGYNPYCYYPYYQESYKHGIGGHMERIVDFARMHGCVVATADYVTAPLKLDNFAFGFDNPVLCPIGANGLLDSIEHKRNFYFMARQGKEAIRFLKSKAGEYNIDPNNITVIGSSAGGLLAQTIAMIDDNLSMPDYATVQPNVVYDMSSDIRDSIWNKKAKMLVDTINGMGHQMTFVPLTNAYPFSLPRPDLGPLNGPTWTNFDSRVKNVVLLISGMPDLTILTSDDPRFFLFGSDQDPAVALAAFAGRDSCLNASPAFIHSEIAARARAVGYVEGQNFEIMESSNPTSHDYNFTDLIARIAAFIQ